MYIQDIIRTMENKEESFRVCTKEHDSMNDGMEIYRQMVVHNDVLLNKDAENQEPTMEKTSYPQSQFSDSVGAKEQNSNDYRKIELQEKKKNNLSSSSSTSSIGSYSSEMQSEERLLFNVNSSKIDFHRNTFNNFMPPKSQHFSSTSQNCFGNIIVNEASPISHVYDFDQNSRYMGIHNKTPVKPVSVEQTPNNMYNYEAITFSNPKNSFNIDELIKRGNQTGSGDNNITTLTEKKSPQYNNEENQVDKFNNSFEIIKYHFIDNIDCEMAYSVGFEHMLKRTRVSIGSLTTTYALISTKSFGVGETISCLPGKIYPKDWAYDLDIMFTPTVFYYPLFEKDEYGLIDARKWVTIVKNIRRSCFPTAKLTLTKDSLGVPQVNLEAIRDIQNNKEVTIPFDRDIDLIQYVIHYNDKFTTPDSQLRNSKKIQKLIKSLVCFCKHDSCEINLLLKCIIYKEKGCIPSGVFQEADNIYQEFLDGYDNRYNLFHTVCKDIETDLVKNPIFICNKNKMSQDELKLYYTAELINKEDLKMGSHNESSFSPQKQVRKRPRRPTEIPERPRKETSSKSTSQSAQNNNYRKPVKPRNVIERRVNRGKAEADEYIPFSNIQDDKDFIYNTHEKEIKEDIVLEKDGAFINKRESEREALFLDIIKRNENRKSSVARDAEFMRFYLSHKENNIPSLYKRFFHLRQTILKSEKKCPKSLRGSNESILTNFLSSEEIDSIQQKSKCLKNTKDSKKHDFREEEILLKNKENSFKIDQDEMFMNDNMQQIKYETIKNNKFI